jgi:pyridoxal phosphate enzyme (YggS family)
MQESFLSTIQERYQYILKQIADSEIRAGRQPGSVRLVVVSKAQPLEVIRAAVAAGISTFGENYTDEAVPKILALREAKAEWHMIGHVQSRKAELVAANFFMLHSLDSLRLARRLERFCKELDRTLPVLLEFNLSGEESKFGFAAWNEESWNDLEGEVEQILAFPHLRVRGLMTMPPYFDDPESTRPYFKRLRYLQEFLTKRFPGENWKELSMGTSVDFKQAIQEGATFVRIGQAILGLRTS